MAAPSARARSVGRRIAELRSERGWTQEGFTERAGRSVQWLRRIEAGGNITLKTFFAIADLLEVDPVALLSAPASMETKLGRPRRATARKARVPRGRAR